MGAGGRAEGRGKWAPEITAKYMNKDGDEEEEEEDQDDNVNDDDRLYR